MRRRPPGIRPLVPMGGEADGVVDTPLGAAVGMNDSANSIVSLQPYEPKFDPRECLSGSELTVVEQVPEMEIDDKEIDEVAQALVREYLNKKKMGPVLKLFDELNPRTPSTISSRAKLRSMLGLGEPNKSYGVLEQVIAQRLLDTKQGHHITLGDAPQHREKKPVPFLVNHSTSSVELGPWVINETGAKKENTISRPSRFCDLSQNKEINHVTDLDLANKTKLGSGMSGDVFGVIHKPTGKEVAVKCIRALEQRQVQEVEKELRTLFDNQCPYIVDFHGSFCDPANPGTIMIVLEKMDESLNHVVKNYGPMPSQAANSCMWQALQALKYLHTARKVIHRDIKPANILYNSRGVVKVSDFGVSSGPVATVDGNVANTYVGTIYYMSPERVSGDDHGYSFPSDIWSIGLVLYYLLTGMVPYHTDSGLCPIFNIIEGAPALTVPATSSSSSPPAVFAPAPPRFPAEILEFYNHCMALEPQDRKTSKQLLLEPWFRNTTEGSARSALMAYLSQPPLRGREEGRASEDGSDALRELDGVLGVIR